MIRLDVPRLVVAAPGSGHGKTSVATGLLAALRARGLAVSGHKVGPDYIDPGYHAIAAGRAGRNLDPWLVGEDAIAPLFGHGATTPAIADIAVVEGVMGLFDGVTGRAGFASTAHVAGLLRAPVVLVIDASGVGRSVAALVHGFATFDPGIRLGGVIFNRVGSQRHREILTEAVESAGVAVLGAIGRRDELVTPSRHLGLVPAAERREQAERTVAALGAAVADGVDLDAVLRLARSAPPLSVPEPVRERRQPVVRVGVAAGAAFTFGYAEQAELLADAGAEVVSFDPLTDERLPERLDGLIIGGGFPESHLAELSANAPARSAVSRLVAAGAPIAAECAGLLYLGRSLDGSPMCGVLDVDAEMTGRLTLGYRDAVAAVSSPLAAAGQRVHGHEFHRTALTAPDRTAGDHAGGPHPAAWHWRHRGAAVTEGFVRGRVHASYLHTHWNGVPGAAGRLVAAAREYRHERAGRQ